MTVSLASLQKLIALKLSTEQMEGVIEVLAVELAPLEEMRAADERRRSKDRARKIQPTSTENQCDFHGNSTEIPASRAERDINPSFLKEGLDNPPSNPPLLPEPSAFTEFWNAYPPREGGSDRDGAEKAFAAATKRADPAAIIAAAGRFGQEMRRIGKAGTQFVPKARKWLNDGGWKDFDHPKVSTDQRLQVRMVPVIEGSPAWAAWQRAKGKAPLPATDLQDESGRPMGKRGWYFPSEFPPPAPPAAEMPDIPPHLKRQRKAPTEEAA